MNFLDRAIGFFDPQAGLKRMAARQAIQTYGREFEGAGHRRNLKNWRTKSSSANVEIGQGLVGLRNRSSDLIRNYDFATNMQQVWVSYVIGNGIRAKADKEDLKLFKEWSLQCDADGNLDFIGLQGLGCSAAFERGEYLVRLRPRRISDGLPVPLQLQLLEGDHLDHTKTEKGNNGAKIIQGVEFNAIGRRVAYWIFPEHPGEHFLSGMGSLKSVRVPASEILHVFEPRRIGQVRGIPALAPVISRIRDMADYEDAERIRKKIEACFMAFITQEGGLSSNPLTQGKKGSDGILEQTIEPGLVKQLPPGTDVKFGQPTGRGGAEYLAYLRTQKEGMSAGISMPYSAVSNDLSQANYSSQRGGELPARRRVRRYQKQVKIPMFCRPIWSVYARYAELGGRPVKTKNAEWVPDKFESVDPLKDKMANLIDIRSGMLPHPKAITESGGDPDEVLEAYAEFLAKADKLGLVFDSDPRRVNKAGSVQDGLQILETEK